MCFSFDNLLFIGHPMCLSGRPYYKRNELLFNLVLVVEQVKSSLAATITVGLPGLELFIMALGNEKIILLVCTTSHGNNV